MVEFIIILKNQCNTTRIFRHKIVCAWRVCHRVIEIFMEILVFVIFSEPLRTSRFYLVMVLIYFSDSSYCLVTVAVTHSGDSVASITLSAV